MFVECFDKVQVCLVCFRVTCLFFSHTHTLQTTGSATFNTKGRKTVQGPILEMPTTSSLLVAPVSTVPYKRGVMYKRSKGFKSANEQKRIFIFKHRTLYWIRDDKQPPEYPQNYLRFDDNIKKIKTKSDQLTIKVETTKKDYYLRCEKMADLQSWFNHFVTALSEYYGDNTEGLSNVIGNKKKKSNSTIMNRIKSPIKKSNNNNSNTSNVSTPLSENNSGNIALMTPTVEDSDTDTATNTETGGTNTPKVFNLTNSIENRSVPAASVVDATYSLVFFFIYLQ